ncbi:MAG: hypothetical protein HOP28_09620 [Gemmatimonadales bacterium]|nr:hypothetical protein [Gemmatimonadales bacterium]
MWACQKCGEEVEDQFEACWKCSTRRSNATDDLYEEEVEDSADDGPQPVGVGAPVSSVSAERGSGEGTLRVPHVASPNPVTLPKYVYKVIPFRAQFTGTATPEGIASQLQAAITQSATDDFELYQVATVTVAVAPGCIGTLLGHKAERYTYEQVIFRKPIG